MKPTRTPLWQNPGIRPPRRTRRSEVKAYIKLFYEHDDEEQCAEAYFNVDSLNGLVEFREKDLDCRLPLVRSLTASLSGEQAAAADERRATPGGVDGSVSAARG